MITLKDSGDLIHELHKTEEEYVYVDVQLPDYMDMFWLNSLASRMQQLSVLTGKTIKMKGKTKLPAVEKFLSNAISTSASVFLQVDWEVEK